MISPARIYILCAAILTAMAATVSAQIPPPSYRFAAERWASATLFPDGSFSPAPGEKGLVGFRPAGATTTTHFHNGQTYQQDGYVFFSSQSSSIVPAVDHPYYFTLRHPDFGTYMGASRVYEAYGSKTPQVLHGKVCWQPWRYGEGPVPTIPTIQSSHQYFRFYVMDIMIVDRPEKQSFVACDESIQKIAPALSGRQFTTRVSYLADTTSAGECVSTGTYVQPGTNRWFYLITWADPEDRGDTDTSCGMTIPEGPIEIEFTIEGYAPSRARVVPLAGKYAEWRPMIYPELGSDAPGASDLVAQPTFPAAFSQEARVRRISGKVDFVMGDFGRSLDRNGDGVVDAADLVGSEP